MHTRKLAAICRDIRVATIEAAAYPLIIIAPPSVGAYEMLSNGARRRGRVVVYSVFGGQDSLRGGMYRDYLVLLPSPTAPLGQPSYGDDHGILDATEPYANIVEVADLSARDVSAINTLMAGA
jgi:hypothetical protein